MKFNKTTILKAKVLATLAAAVVVLGPISMASVVCKYARAAFHALLEYVVQAIDYLYNTAGAKVSAADKELADHLDDELDAARQELYAHNCANSANEALKAANAAYDAALNEYYVNHKLKQESLQAAVASAITARNAVR